MTMTPTDIRRSWHRGDWMQTNSGKRFYPLEPQATDVDLRDIAHSLSLQCRYNGHVDKFYSVAEHCVLLAEWFIARDDVTRARIALLHDSTETYVGDLIRPIKRSMPGFVLMEADVELAIARHFNMPGDTLTDSQVTEADTRILIDERRALMTSTEHAWTSDLFYEPLGVDIRAWSPEVAKAEYLRVAALLDLA